MIIRPSAQLAKRLKCEITEAPSLPEHQRHLSSWSGDLFAFRGVGSHALMMHDATLFTFLVPLEGIRSFEPFVVRFLDRVAAIWSSLGASFDPQNQNVVALKRSNRSLIGTMNEAKRLLGGDMIHSLENIGTLNWTIVEHQMNEVPYSVLKYRRPIDALRKLLRGS